MKSNLVVELSREEIIKVLHNYAKDLMKGSPSLQGGVEVKFDIEATPELKLTGASVSFQYAPRS